MVILEEENPEMPIIKASRCFGNAVKKEVDKIPAELTATSFRGALFYGRSNNYNASRLISKGLDARNAKNFKLWDRAFVKIGGVKRVIRVTS